MESQRPTICCRGFDGLRLVLPQGKLLNIGLGLTPHCAFRKRGRLLPSFKTRAGPPQLPGRPTATRTCCTIFRPRGPGRRPVLIGDVAGLSYTRAAKGSRRSVGPRAEVIRAAAGDYRVERLQRTADCWNSGSVNAAAGRRPPDKPRPRGGNFAGRLWPTAGFVRRVVMHRWFLHSNQPPPRNLGDLVGSSRGAGIVRHPLHKPRADFGVLECGGLPPLWPRRAAERHRHRFSQPSVNGQRIRSEYHVPRRGHSH